MTEQPTSTDLQPKRQTLFDISADLTKLSDLLDEIEGDEEQHALIQEWLEATAQERDRKLDGYAALIGELTARAEARKAEAKRLTGLATLDENRAAKLKQNLQWFFERHNLKKLETPRYRLTLASNGGKAPVKLDEVNPEDLPLAYQKVTIKPDLDAIRTALEAGEELGFAWLAQRGQSIRIK